MATINKTFLGLDKNKELQANLITQEAVTPSTGAANTVVYLKHSIFFADGFSLYTNPASKTASKLTLGTDYVLSGKDDAASKNSGYDCYRTITFTVPFVQTYVDYHAYGDIVSADILNQIIASANDSQEKTANHETAIEENTAAIEANVTGLAGKINKASVPVGSSGVTQNKRTLMQAVTIDETTGNRVTLSGWSVDIETGEVLRTPMNLGVSDDTHAGLQSSEDHVTIAENKAALETKIAKETIPLGSSGATLNKRTLMQAITIDEITGTKVTLSGWSIDVETGEVLKTPVEIGVATPTAAGLQSAETVTFLQELEAMLPSAAGSSNKLVDMATMNSSIQSATATRVYADNNKGNFLTRAAIVAAEMFYNAAGEEYTPDANDYTIINADEGAPAPFTGGQTRWKFTGGAFGYDYGINSRPFTQAENDVLGSGATAALIAQITTNKNNIASEIANREAAIASEQERANTALTNAITTEATARAAQIAALNTQIVDTNNVLAGAHTCSITGTNLSRTLNTATTFAAELLDAEYAPNTMPWAAGKTLVFDDYGTMAVITAKDTETDPEHPTYTAYTKAINVPNPMDISKVPVGTNGPTKDLRTLMQAITIKSITKDSAIVTGWSINLATGAVVGTDMELPIVSPENVGLMHGDDKKKLDDNTLTVTLGSEVISPTNQTTATLTNLFITDWTKVPTFAKSADEAIATVALKDEDEYIITGVSDGEVEITFFVPGFGSVVKTITVTSAG